MPEVSSLATIIHHTAKNPVINCKKKKHIVLRKWCRSRAVDDRHKPPRAKTVKLNGPLNGKLSSNALPDGFTNKSKATCIHCRPATIHHGSMKGPKCHPLTHSWCRKPICHCFGWTVPIINQTWAYLFTPMLVVLKISIKVHLELIVKNCDLCAIICA